PMPKKAAVVLIAAKPRRRTAFSPYLALLSHLVISPCYLALLSRLADLTSLTTWRRHTDETIPRSGSPGSAEDGRTRLGRCCALLDWPTVGVQSVEMSPRHGWIVPAGRSKAMQVGVFLPISGRAAGPEALREAAQSAEAQGFDAVWSADRVVTPWT